MNAAVSARRGRTAGDLSGIVFVLTFVAGALCGFFSARLQSADAQWALDLPQLSACGELRTFAALLGAYSLMFLCACARPLRPAAYALSGVLCAACVFCTACFWRTWGYAGFYLSCWLLLPRLLLCAAAALVLRRPKLLAVLAAPAVLLAQFLLYPVFSMSFAQMI